MNASDLAPPLIAVDAVATIEGPGGAREVALEAFYAVAATDPQRETLLEPGDVLTAVTVPPVPPEWRGSYFKARERTAGDFPIVSLALGYELNDGRMTHVRLVLGGVAPAPSRVHDAEAALKAASRLRMCLHSRPTSRWQALRRCSTTSSSLTWLAL